MRRFFPLLVILISLAATAGIAARVYDRLPRLEDDLAYLYQARLFASGQLYAATPPVEPLAFGVPFVVDLNGKRFSKYPPGGSLPIALGLLLGDVWMIGPLLGTLALAVTYRLGRDLYDEPTALAAILLGVTSPFFLVLTPTLMAHASSMLAAGIFVLTFLRLRKRPSRTLAIVAGAALGFEFLVRPYTAIWSAAPVAFIAAGDVWRDRRNIERHSILAVSALVISSLLPLYNYTLTGQVRLSLYDLWWSFDRIGFGPDIGPYGFTAIAAVRKTISDLLALMHDLHGVPFLSLIPLTLGLLLPPRSRTDALLFAAFVSLGVGAFFYHSGTRLYGPRYFYEAWPMMMLLGARGLLKLVRSLRQRRIARMLAYTAIGIFFGIAIFFYIPFRLSLMRHLYNDVLNWKLAEAVKQGDIHHALVFMFADDWPDAAVGTILNDPGLEADVLYPRYFGPDSYPAIVDAYPNRAVYFWRDGVLTRTTDPPPEWYPAYPTVRYPNP
ncbi:MAG TPA: glycosyltransferase family 39 protein [Anaerolineales bacterium]|nr:glycosyltransferase family 39 protein [Anaerolineales bacterium]